ncbi:MAG: DUF2085 domain-containing protein [Bacteroidota bacterium]
MLQVDDRVLHIHRARIVYIALLSGTLLWCSAIVAAPLLVNSPWSHTADFLYRFFHPICNQLDSHSFHIDGEKTAVCMRCSSIYFSFLLGLLMYPLLRPIGQRIGLSRAWLFVAVAPMTLDAMLSLFGIHESTSLSRILTGSLFGVIAVFIVVPIIVDAISELRTRPRVQPFPTTTKD